MSNAAGVSRVLRKALTERYGHVGHGGWFVVEDDRWLWLRVSDNTYRDHPEQVQVMIEDRAAGHGIYAGYLPCDDPVWTEVHVAVAKRDWHAHVSGKSMHVLYLNTDPEVTA